MSDPRHPRSARIAAGFSLIELLVVVAILSLLVSILLPSLTKAKELAARVACATNVRQIALAHSLYSQDWEERLLYCPAWPGSWPTNWFEQLFPYASAAGTFVCLRHDNPAGNYNFWGRPHPNVPACSYAANEWVVSRWGNMPETLSETQRPYELILFCDARHPYVSGPSGRLDEPWEGDLRVRFDVGRHEPDGTGGNFGFLDGRADFIPEADFGRYHLNAEP
jgi:prepilin-type N-terminal cleavage/methylation domain-containing protein